MVFTEDRHAPFDCLPDPLFPNTTTTTWGPLTLTPLAQSHDEDGDGCTDWEELGTNQALGGLRDPFNSGDFYDVNGDKYVDLANDILGVAGRYTVSHGGYHTGVPDDDRPYDRGPNIGPNQWDMTPRDGNIDLANDITGVGIQYQHDCRPAP